MHLVVNYSNSFLYLWLNIIHVSFIYSSNDGHLGCVHVVTAVVNSAALNMGVHISFQISVFIFYG